MQTTSAGRFTVFLVNHDQGTLDTLGSLLRSAGYTTKTYTSPKAFLDEHDSSVHGCAVLELSMPDLNKANIQQELAKRGINRPIIFLGENGSIPAGAEAFKSGAIDLLIKPVQNPELLSVIKTAMKRDSNRLHRQAIAKRVSKFTSRERLIVALVVRGMSDKHVAAALRIRQMTVRTNLSRAMKKLGVKSVADLVRMTGKISL